MDSKHLRDINKSLHDIHEVQAKLWDHVTKTSGNLLEQTTKRYHKVCKLMKSLEDTFGLTINDDIQKLIVKVNQIATDTEYLKRTIASRVPLASLNDIESTKTKRLTDSSLDTDSQENARDDYHERDHSGIRNEYDSSKLSFPDDDMHRLLRKTSSAVLSERPLHQEGENIEHAPNQSDLEIDGDTTAIWTNNLDTGIKDSIYMRESESEEDNETVDPVTESYHTIGIKTTVNSVKRNEFGFKRKLDSPQTDNRVDNRVAFHYRQFCFLGRMVHSGFESEESTEDSSPQCWNIPPPYLHGDHQSGQGGKQSDGLYLRDTDLLEEYGEYGVDNFDKPKTMKQWHEYAEQLRTNSLVRTTSGCVKRGSHGHDAVLVLDCSKRMTGEKFEAIKAAAVEYVNGIKAVHTKRGLEDNIGLAIFGGHSTLVLESTSDYELVKATIDSLQTGGDAPLLGGLLMGLAGVLGGATSHVLQNAVQGHMIVFTDSTSDKEWHDLDSSDINPAYLTGDFRMESEGVIDKIAGHAIKIYYVPVGESQENSIMEQAVRKSRGKIIQKYELHRLIRMTQVLLIAAHVATGLRQEKCDVTRDLVRQKIIQKSGKSEDAHDDCVDLVIEFMDPMLSDKHRGMYSELMCKSLALGDRVRRGQNWLYGDQDSDMPGTVVGQDKKGSIWVEWDNGYVNVYHYNEMGICSIRKVLEPRDMSSDISSGFIRTGYRVVRGPAWCYGNDDGGDGCEGTVLGVKPDGSVVVRWDCSIIGVYRTGFGVGGLHEVQISLQSFSNFMTDSSTLLGKRAIDDHLDIEHSKEDLWKECEKHNLQTTKTKNDIKISSKNNDGKEFTFGKSKHENSIVSFTGGPVKVGWEYTTDRGWKPFDQALSDKMEKAYHKKPSTIVLINNKSYKIDFQTWIKIDTVSKERVKIRRRELSD